MGTLVGVYIVASEKSKVAQEIDWLFRAKRYIGTNTRRRLE
jgi:hypothetical protein